MKLDNIIDILISSIKTGDFSTFFDNFMEDDSYKENLDDIFLKLGEFISIFITDLPQKEDSVSNVLQILTELIEAYELRSEDLALELAKVVLLLITDEKCSITNIKRAIHVFNLIIQKPEIIFTIVHDESLEGTLQILGRKVPTIGDYECQALMFEALYRITCNENRKYWVNIWFPDCVARSMFMELDPLKFEANCRKALNYINRNEIDRRVFSFVATSIKFGSFQLIEPYGCDFWVDFNYDSQSISFYCSEVTFDEPTDNSGMWETILISNSSVKNYSVEDRESKKELLLLLNCPCHTLITASCITNSAFNSSEVRILIWKVQDIHRHLEKIYGEDKYIPNLSAQKLSEVSVPSDAIQFEDGVLNVLSNEKLSERKVSNLCSPMHVDVCENEVLSSEVFSGRKVSNLCAPVQVDVCENEIFSNEVLSDRKISNLYDPIPVNAFGNEDIIAGTDKNQNFSVFRKISETVETIHFATEILPENLRSLRKMSSSSEIIQCETSKVVECVQRTKRRSAVSVDTIFYDPNVVDVTHDKEREKEFSTSSKDVNNMNQGKEKDLSSSSKETYNSEGISKSNNYHRVRLYNPDTAPVYDVPPVARNSDPQSQDHFSCKSTSYVGKDIHANAAENTVNTHESCVGQKDASVVQRIQSTKKRKSKSVEDSNQRTDKDKQIKLYEDFPESDEDFQEPFNRGAVNRRAGKSSVLTSIQNKKNSRKRKFEASHSDDSPSTKEKSAKRPRRAAVKSMRRTREMLETKSIVTCDKIEVMKESSEDSEKIHSKKKKNSKINTDTDTQSSEVSWMKQNKPCYLFETPKKNYSEWRKSLQRKKSLPIEIICGSKSLLKEPPHKKKKKDINTYKSHDSETKSKSWGWSDLENYNLTVEKNVKRNSYPLISALESDFQNISSGPKRNSSKESSHSHLHIGIHNADPDFKNSSKQQLKDATEIVATDDTMNAHADTCKILHVCRTKHTDTSSNIEPSDSVKEIPNKEHEFSNVSNDAAEIEGDLICDENQSNIDGQIASHIDCDDLIQEENEEEMEKNLSKHTLEDTSELCSDCPPHKYRDYLREKKGKSLILQRFLKSVAVYSETLMDSSRTTLSEPGIDSHLYSPQVSIKSISTRVKSVESHRDSGFQYEGDIEISPKSLSEENVNNFAYQRNKRNNNATVSPVLSAKMKKHKERLNKEKSISVCDKLAEKVGTLPPLKSVADSSTCRNEQENQNVIDKVVSERIVPISKQFEGSEKSFKKHKHLRKLKDFNDISFNSVNSKLTSSTLFKSGKDRKWFDAVTSVLLQDANNLSRKLLATVQKCFWEFIIKMNTLRENIIKAVEEFEIPSAQNVHPFKIRNLIKNCKIIRLEVEKSLRRMLDTGREYFEAEEKCFRKLKRKHIKASKKFISNMRRAQHNSIRTLEGKILFKTKSHLKSLLKHIQST